MTRSAILFFLSVASSAVLAQDAKALSTTCGLTNFQKEFVQRINQARSKTRNCGSRRFAAVGPMRWNSLLTESAAGHSRDMALNNFFDHKSQDGSTFSDRISDTGYEWISIGENISAGRRTVEEAMNGWLKSPPHCANIMNPRFNEVGVACVQRSGTKYQYHWTMNLGRPKASKSSRSFEARDAETEFTSAMIDSEISE